MCVFSVFFMFFVLFSFAAFSFSTLILLVGSLTCKNRLPYNLYCVGGDVKHCSLTQSLIQYNLVVCRLCVHSHLLSSAVAKK